MYSPHHQKPRPCSHCAPSSNGNPMPNLNQMKNSAMMSAQMQRDGSQMDMNGQRPQSPGSNENGGSPNKRQRVEGTHSISPRTALARSQGLRQAHMDHSGSEANHMPFAGAMNAGNMPGNQFGEFAQQGQNVQQKQIEVYAQSLAQQQKMALNNHQGMNNVAQGSPMNQSGLPGEGEIFVGNQPRPAGMPAGGAPPQGNHALQDYQMQLMLLEQQNKKRLLMARQEQDSMSGPHAQGPGVGPGFPPSMSPQGSRAGPSPNPSDQMKKGATPRMGPQVLPGSPMPEGAMQPQRNSPAPGVAFDPNTMPPGMPPQFANYPNGMNPQMMRPPSSHPQFNGQQVTQEQMQIIQRNQMAAMQNGGVWRGPQGQPGMMPGQQQMGPMGANPQQNRQMPPPPAPAGEQPRTEPSPSQPAAPPTPSQANKGNPKKKNTKDNKVKLRAICPPLSIVDIDIRSPQTRKGQQVRLQQLPVAKNQRLRRPRSHPYIPSRRLVVRTDSSSLRRPLSRSNLRNNSSRRPWTTTALGHLAN